VFATRNGDGKLFKTGGIESAPGTDDMIACELLCDAVMKRLGQYRSRGSSE